jgi:hypothetical protein
MMAVAAQDWREHGDGTIDILGILTGLRVSSVPLAEPQINLFVSFSASPAEVGMEKIIEILLLDADGDPMRRSQATITVPESPRPGSRSDFNLNFPLKNVPFVRAGDYGFHILVGDDDKRTVPFYISVEEGES